MATSFAVVRRSDLGAGLGQDDGKVVARTIVKQASVNGSIFLVDSNNVLLPSEVWTDMQYMVSVYGDTRMPLLSELILDAATKAASIRAGTVVASVTGYDPLEDDSVIYDFGRIAALLPTLNRVGTDIGIMFGKLPAEFPYLTFAVTGSQEFVPVLGDRRAKFGGMNMGQYITAAEFETDAAGIELTPNSLHIRVPVGQSVITPADTPIPISADAFADWDNPTQGEWEAAQGAFDIFQFLIRPDAVGNPAGYKVNLFAKFVIRSLAV